MVYRSSKLFKGYSTVFRQHLATHSHCQFLHGYSLQFEVVFTGELDDKNWIVDFGRFKSDGVKEWFKYFFDHTVIVADDDPHKEKFEELQKSNLVQLRALPAVGCEKFAEIVFAYLSKKINDDRVYVEKVTCIENDTNWASVSVNSFDQKKLNELYLLAVRCTI